MINFMSSRNLQYRIVYFCSFYNYADALFYIGSYTSCLLVYTFHLIHTVEPKLTIYHYAKCTNVA